MYTHSTTEGPGLQTRFRWAKPGLYMLMLNSALRSGIVWYSVRCKQWLNIVKYWNRFINIPASRLILNLFHWDYENGVLN